ncbi:MAG TPA: hypothetical protein VKR24_00480 [Candidatus Limnocylindrales bacterium]|nr:hypothetical protein [Candidatus Limnocylindrales bacterium]
MATGPKDKLPLEPASHLIADTPQGAYVSCPNCGRPVADGLVRCSGCGMRILMGVAASRALLFLTTGAVLGLLVGGLSVGWLMGITRPVVGPPVAAAATSLATSHPAPASAEPSSGPASAVDPIAASALRQIASTDAQLAGSLSSLKHELQARTIDTGAISSTLRQMSAAATYGASVVGYLSAWSDAADVQGNVGRLYEQVRAIAARGLAANLASSASYKNAGDQLVVALDVLQANRAAEFALGDSAGINLPGAPTPAAGSEPSPTASN